MNQTEKVDLLSRIANLIIHKTNIGAWSAINNVLTAAKTIVESRRLPEQEYIPDSMLETLKTCGMTMADISAFQARRRDNMLFLQSLIVWLLNKTHNAIELQLLDWEILQLEDDVPAVSHLTAEHIAEYKARKVLRIDTELTLVRVKLEAIYSLMDVADLKPEQTFAVIGTFSHEELTTLGFDLVQHKQNILNLARDIARMNANATVNEVIVSVKNKTSISDLALKPKYLQLILTNRFQLEIAQAMTPEGLLPPLPKPTALENYIKAAFDSWMACTDGQFSQCTYKILRSQFRRSLLPQDKCMHTDNRHNGLMRAHKELIYFLTPQNSSHAIHALYTLTDDIIVNYKAQGTLMPVSQVCQEIMNVMLENKPQQLKIKQSIVNVLAQLDPGYVKLACESKRTALADQLQNFSLPIPEVFNLVSRTSLPQAKDLTHVFTGNKDYACFSYSIDVSFDKIEVDELHTLHETVTKFGLDLNLVMNLYGALPKNGLLDNDLQDDFNGLQLAVATIAKCDPISSKHAFFNGSHLISSIRNPVLLTTVAGMLTSCLDHGFRNHAPVIREVEHSPIDNFDSRIILGLAAYATPVIMVLGVSLCLRFKPVTMIKSAVSNLFFGGRKRPTEKLKIEDMESLLPNHAMS
jgi:hypothetical protein